MIEGRSIVSLAEASIGADGSFEVRVGVPSSALTEASPPLVCAGTDLRWGAMRAGLVLSDARWYDGSSGPGQYVTALAFPLLRAALLEAPDDVGLAVVSRFETVRVGGVDVPVRLVECDCAVLVRPGREPVVRSVIEAAVTSRREHAMGVHEDLERQFVRLGLSEAGAKHAAAGRAGGVVVTRGTGTSKAAGAQREVEVSQVSQSGGDSSTPSQPSALEESFRRLGLSEAGAKHAAAGR